jgi:putative sensory transduction regulator
VTSLPLFSANDNPNSQRRRCYDPRADHPENLSKESLQAIFAAALMETSIDTAGELQVREALQCLVLPSNSKDRIRLLALFGFEPQVSHQQRLEFVNQVNSEFILIRATVGAQDDTLMFDHYLWVQGGITKQALVLATQRFLSICGGAVQEFGKDLVK